MIKDDPEKHEKSTKEQELQNNLEESSREYWTEHRITLIAYEAQYIYEKRLLDVSQEKQNDSSKRGNRKKIMIEYQSGFLSISENPSTEFEVKDIVKKYENLNWLFHETTEKDMLHLKQFIEIMLSLKHSQIVEEFCQIYDMLLLGLKKLAFKDIEKEEDRFRYLKEMEEKVVGYVKEKKQRFTFMEEYLRMQPQRTGKLIEVQGYCLMAQKFNFNINEFYSEAFGSISQGKPSKRVKKQ